MDNKWNFTEITWHTLNNHVFVNFIILIVSIGVCLLEIPENRWIKHVKLL